MAKIIDRITLDLNKDELYVWEMKKSRLVVDAIREGIKIGCDFPAVDVVMSESGIYQLLLVGCLSPVSRNYGGHNRAFAI